ncbi:MAG: DUF1565 domain-containing protein [Candidatus Omnitrophica bacterium]|nr:DUF1565 domain-containing protein [Candidatus Omnitrophota bacterium]
MRNVFLSGLAVLCLSLSAFAADEYVSSINNPETDRYYPSKIRFGAQASSEHRGSFYVDYLFPVWYAEDETSLIFFNPKQSIHSTNAEETNLGIGYRKLFNDWFILGAHIFYDKKLSENDVFHSQMGYGAEFLSEMIDVRFNYYNPIHGAKQIDDGYELGETGLLYWNELEEPLEGFDFEFGSPEILNTKLYLGGYFYDSKLTKDKEGIRIRTETDINKWLSLDLQCKTENKQELEFTGGFRVTIPLELGKAFDRRQKRMKEFLDIFEVKQRSRMKERLLDRVVRDIDIQTTVKNNQPIPASGTDVQDIIYVDNSNSGAENGTLSNPWDTLAEAFVDPRYGPGMTIYVFEGDGTPTGLTGNYILANNVILWGSAYNGGFPDIETTSGYPKIDGGGGLVNPIITLANNNTIMGCQIQNNRRYGIYGLNRASVNIHHNYIKDFPQGGGGGVPIQLTISNPDTYSYTISNNTIADYTGGSNGAVTIAHSAASTNVHVVVMNNHFENDSNAALLLWVTGGDDFSSLTAQVTQNAFISNNNGLYLISSEGSVNAVVSQNTFSQNTTGIYCVDLSIGATTPSIEASFDNNSIVDSTGNGILFEVRHLGAASSLKASISNTRITGNGQNGVILQKIGVGVDTINIDLGNGSLGATGNNLIYNNANFDISNLVAGVTISAENNWWGQDPPVAGQFNGLVDYTPYLTTAP